MSERKLASIRRIANIEPIEGADRIVKATVDGWSLVTQKDNGFQVGDLVVYFEIDSVLPEREQFEFLRDRCYVSAERSINGAGFRLKTIRLKGVYSQGLILPISSLATPSEDYPDGWDFVKTGKAEHFEDRVEIPMEIITFLPEEGDDLTEILGVVKYEKPLPAQLAGTARGNFPSFIRKTDEERVQNCIKYVTNKWEDHEWEITTKLDGSSFTAYFNRDGAFAIDNQWTGTFGVCSRNLDLKETEENAFWQVARKYDLETKLKKLGRSFAIQGELMGPGVQGNKEGLTELEMFVFNVFDIEKQSYLTPEERYAVVEILDLKHVPINALSYKLDQGITVGDILKMAEGPSLKASTREGIVFKSHTDPNVSFKAISNAWLLKNEE